jgi:hypothetical protein
MATSQASSNAPPSPGGDPDQSDNDVPVPAPRNDEVEDKKESGYGRTGNREGVAFQRAPQKPQQIF